MDRARRGEAGRDDDRFARRTTLRFGDDIVREAETQSASVLL